MSTYRTFELYMADVDRYLLKKYGVTSDGIPDYLWRDAYDTNVSIKEAAEDAIERAAEY